MGKEYGMPMGSGMSSGLTGFGNVDAYVMAAEDNTLVAFADGSVKTLQEGESVLASQVTGEATVVGEKITANKAISVSLVVVEAGLNRVRYFMLTPVGEWGDAYISPKGDGFAASTILLYNPNDQPIEVKYEYLWLGVKASVAYNIESKKAFSVPATTTGYLSSSVKFAAYSTTGLNIRRGLIGSLTASASNALDFDLPLTSTNKLSSDVLISHGNGCGQIDCQKPLLEVSTRETVVISPTAAADIYIDEDNDGKWDQVKANVGFLSSTLLSVKLLGQELAGSHIWAVVPGSDPYEGEKVDIAVDLGIYLPCNGIQAVKSATLVGDLDNGGDISFGDILKYSIDIWNVGRLDLSAGEVIVKDSLDANVQYVPNSLVYVAAGKRLQIADHVVQGTSVSKLDGEGVSSKNVLEKEGLGKVTLEFEIKLLDDPIGHAESVINRGMVQTKDGVAPFFLETTVSPRKTPSKTQYQC